MAEQKLGSGGAKYIAEQFVENLKGMFVGLQEDVDRVEHKTIPDIYENLRKHGEDIAALKVKAGVWGAIGGMIPIAIYLIVEAIKHAK